MCTNSLELLNHIFLIIVNKNCFYVKIIIEKRIIFNYIYYINLPTKNEPNLNNYIL